MFVGKRFLSGAVIDYGKHSVFSTDRGSTWYRQSCQFLKLKHHMHLYLEMSDKKDNEVYKG